jgi:hypothetical protein
MGDQPEMPEEPPTREQVLKAIEDNVWRSRGREHAADAVMALIARPDREPLWRGKTKQRAHHEDSSVIDVCVSVDIPPGTAVRVDEDTT